MSKKWITAMFLVSAVPTAALAEGPIGTSAGPDVGNITGCVVFTDENFGGASRNVISGTLGYVGDSLNDQVSSIACTTDCSMTTFQDRDFHGPSHSWRSNIAYVGDGWNDRISSLIVECKSTEPSNPPAEESSVLVPQESSGPSPFGAPVDPLNKAGVLVKPGEGIGGILKETKPAPTPAQGFAGLWDTKTGDGVNYTLTLDAQGSGSVGAVDARLDGMLQGGLSSDGKLLSFVLTQPKAGIVSRGQLSLSADSSSFSGQITKDTEGQPRSWTGTRRP